ncbi:hypothetical protein [Staphylococcus phage vB_SauM-V1SA22]|nr:hypothetical protein [Staphylococcus phage vB_SauM-V1SA22]
MVLASCSYLVGGVRVPSQDFFHKIPTKISYTYLFLK